MEVDDGIWLVSFMDYDLGYVDLEERDFAALKRILLVRKCKVCLRSIL